MKIALLRVGGWENWVDTVAGFLARNGIEVTALVYVPEFTEPLRACPGVKLVTEVLPRGKLGKLGAVWHAGRLLRRHLAHNDYDVLYVVDSWSIPTLWVATNSRLRWRNLPLVYHTFEWLDPNVHNFLHRGLEQSICRKADLVINIDRMRGRIQQMLYRLPTPPLWVRTSLSRDYCVPMPSQALRRELLGENSPADAVAVFCPSIASGERLARELIESFAWLPQKYRLAMMVGEGRYFQTCIELVEKLGLSQRVTFLPRMSFHRAMEYVVCADIGAVLHNGRESLGNYLANPMRMAMFAAAGIPFFASDFPALAGEIYRYQLGVCCDEHDPKSITGAIRLLAEEVPLLDDRKSTILEAFRSNLCFEVSADALLRRLKQVITLPSPH